MAARVRVVVIAFLLASSVASPSAFAASPWAVFPSASAPLAAFSSASASLAAVRADNAPVGPSAVAVPWSKPLTVCSWTVIGQSSNCDGLDPLLLFKAAAWPTACTTSNDLLVRRVESTTLAGGLYVQVTYSGGANHGCRTVAASLYAPEYTGSGLCKVTLVRTSDGTTATSRVARRGGFWSAETQALYDNSVTSYARVLCSWGGHTYRGRTGAY